MKYLFESKSLSGDIKKSNKKQSKIAKNIRINTFPTMLENVCSTIPANSGSKQFLGNQEVFSSKYFVFDCMHSGSVRIYDDTCPTLLSRMGTGGNQTPITFCTQGFAKINASSIGSTLKASGGTYGRSSENFIVNNIRVRKLTPLECERLQGLPDNYTDIPYKGKQHSPLSKKYEAIGNSMAVPVVKWILSRLNTVEKLYRRKL